MSGSVERLWRRILSAIGVGKINFVDDTAATQTVQVELTPGEIRDPTYRLAEYGFVSNPPEGSDAVMVCVGGDRSNGVIIATGHQDFRPRQLAPGEAGIHDNKGRYCIFRQDGGLEIYCAGSAVRIHGCTKLSIDALVDSAEGYEVAGVQVVGPQMPIIPPPAGGGTIDAQARATIVQILQVLDTHGLTGTGA